MKDNFSIVNWKESHLPKLLKEVNDPIYYPQSDPESVEEAFSKAGINMNGPVYVVEVPSRKEPEPAYKANPKELAVELQQIKDDMGTARPGFAFDYDLTGIYKPIDYDLVGTKGRLIVEIGTIMHYVIFQ